MSRKKQKIFVWILLILWLSIIFWFSSQNAEDSSELSQGFLRTLVLWLLPKNVSVETVDFLEYLVRKTAHLTEYAILAILVSVQLHLHEFFERERFKILFAVGFVMFYAATDEFHQLFVGGRSGRVSDVLIDTFGGLIGALLVSVVCKRKYLKK